MTMEPADATLPLSPGTWELDPNHSGVYFKVRHIGLSNVHGRFNRFTAALTVGATLAETKVEATIDMSSVDTNQPDRDAHLRSTDFFSADTHPVMTFTSTALDARGHQAYEMEGDLTINGVTRPVILSVEYQGSETFPGDGKLHAGFAAIVDVNREDFGIDFNMPIGLAGFAVGKSIRVELEMQFSAPQDG